MKKKIIRNLTSLEKQKNRCNDERKNELYFPISIDYIPRKCWPMKKHIHTKLKFCGKCIIINAIIRRKYLIRATEN